MEIVAHRGSSHEAPENTLAAFRLAWEEAADAAELDLRLSRDGRPVVIHDENTARTTARPALVGAQTLEELRSLDAGIWKAPRWAGERIPTFSEVLAVLPAGKKLFAEIKCGREIIPALRKSMITSGKDPGQVWLIGFSFETMEAVRRELPGHSVSWLVKMTAPLLGDGWTPPIEELIAKSRGARLDGLGLNATEAIDAELVSRVRTAGLRLNVWTVDDPGVARRLQDLGVDYLTTNRPGWLRRQL